MRFQRRNFMEQSRFKRETSEAARELAKHAPGTVKDALGRAGFPGCQSIKDAFEVAKEKARIQKALERE
jgi:hypothetical protein